MCVGCWHLTQSEFGSETQSFDFAQVRFGLRWQHNQHGFRHAQLIHALKGKQGCPFTWKALAQEFQLHHGLAVAGRSWIVVPAPPRKVGEKDHSFLWARHLAQTMGGHSLSLLKRVDSQVEQKSKDRMERQGVKMLPLSSEIQSWLARRLKRGWSIALADDVVTTGATAHAAWEALGRPRSFEVWALSYRTTLRNSSFSGYNAASNQEAN